MQLLEEICNYESNTNQCIRKIRLERLFAESPLDKSRLNLKACYNCPVKEERSCHTALFKAFSSHV